MFNFAAVIIKIGYMTAEMDNQIVDVIGGKVCETVPENANVLFILMQKQHMFFSRNHKLNDCIGYYPSL